MKILKWRPQYIRSEKCGVLEQFVLRANEPGETSGKGRKIISLCLSLCERFASTPTHTCDSFTHKCHTYRWRYIDSEACCSNIRIQTMSEISTYPSRWSWEFSMTWSQWTCQKSPRHTLETLFFNKFNQMGNESFSRFSRGFDSVVMTFIFNWPTKKRKIVLLYFKFLGKLYFLNIFHLLGKKRFDDLSTEVFRIIRNDAGQIFLYSWEIMFDSLNFTDNFLIEWVLSFTFFGTNITDKSFLKLLRLLF